MADVPDNSARRRERHLWPDPCCPFQPWGAERAPSSESQALSSSLALPHRPSGLGPAAALSESSLFHLVDEGPDLGIPRAPSRMAGLWFQLLPILLARGAVLGDPRRDS